MGGQQVDQPAQGGAEAADQDAPALDVEDQAEAHAGAEGPEAGEHVAGQALGRGKGGAGEPAAEQQGDGGAQGDGSGHQQNLGGPGQAGDDIPRHNLPHGVGQRHAGDQDHQGADGDALLTLSQAGPYQQQGHPGGHGGTDQGAEKDIRAGKALAEQQAGTHRSPAQCGGQPVTGAPAEKKGEESGRRRIAQQQHPGGEPGALRLQPVHQSLGLLQGKGLPAQPAAQGVAPLQQLDVRPVGGDAAHPGDRVSLRGIDADDETGGDGEDLGRGPVGGEQAVHRLLHPVDLGSAGHQPAAQLGAQIQQFVVIHRISAPSQQRIPCFLEKARAEATMSFS